MRAAIYARKSTSQADVADEAKSCARQVEGARTFIALHGWHLNEAHIYEDDGVSGALFASREQFQRLMQDAEAGCFDCVVLFDLDRFGRNAQKTMTALNTLADVGVQVWDYSTGRAIDVDSMDGGITTFLRAHVAQQYREQVRKHTRDAMLQKAKAGLVTGCKVFGYDNVRIGKGQVKRVINEEEAAIVREIHERAARGEGLKHIAYTLNARRVPSPRAQRGRPSGWDPGTIRAILRRELYRGEIVYGRTKKAYGRELGRKSKREKGQVWTPEESWVRVPAPELRIITPELERAVDLRLGERRSRYLRAANGQLLGRQSPAAKYLLSGFLICTCGARFEALKGGNWSYTGAVYVCAARRRKGPSVCDNTLALPIDYMDNVVLTQVQGEYLTEEFIDRVVESAYAERADADRTAIEADREKLQRAIRNLTAAIADSGGDDIPQLVSALKEMNRKLKATEARLAPREEPDRAALRLALQQRVAEWREILRKHSRQARMVLQQLVEPIRLHNEGTRPAWLGTPRYPGILAGIANGTYVASPLGLNLGLRGCVLRRAA